MILSRITFPSVGISLDPPTVAFRLGGLTVYWYGIILATGLYMILHNIFESATVLSPNVASVILTAVLSVIYFGSRKIRKNGKSFFHVYLKLKTTFILKIESGLLQS